MRVRPSYTPEFRADAVALLRRSERSYRQVALDLGVANVTLRDWYKRDEMSKKGRAKGSAKAVPAAVLKDESAEDRVARLERENAALRGKGLLHHSDRGCQYTSVDYRELLRANGVTVSMSRKGNCWDNAVAESFFATLKNELVHRRRWRSRHELRNALFEYIEVFYNRRRLHSSLSYKTPAEVEEAYTEAA